MTETEHDEQARVVIVTGAAGGGSGTAIVKRLVTNGYSVVASGLDRHRSELAALQTWGAERGHSIAVEIGDVSSEVDAASIVASAASGQGNLYGVIHNAATSLPPVPTHELLLDHWNREFAVISTGAFLLAKYSAPHMVSSGEGRFIFISSSAAFRGARGRSASYSAAKASLFGLMYNLSLEYGPAGVTSNAIAPSQIDTPRARAGGRRTDESIRNYADGVPLGRVAVPEDVAGAVEFLLSSSSSYITGQTIRLDGGHSLAPAGSGLARGGSRP